MMHQARFDRPNRMMFMLGKLLLYKRWSIGTIKVFVFLLFPFGSVAGVEECFSVSMEAIAGVDGGAGVIRGPGIGLSFKCGMRDTDTGAMWYSYEGPFTVYRDGVFAAMVSQNQYRDEDVPVGESHAYRVVAHGVSSEAKTFTCDVNYVVTSPADDTLIGIASNGGTASLYVSAVKLKRAGGRIDSTDCSWSVSSDADWCTIQKSSAKIDLLAEPNNTGTSRRTVVMILVGDCIRRRITLEQAGSSEGMITITTGEGSEISVPIDWFARYADFNKHYGNDLHDALLMKNGKRDADGNELYVWQDYVMGTDPTDVGSTFKAGIDIENGIPKIKWEPNLNTNGENRIYTVYGRERLDYGGWVCPTNSLHRFFKVSVDMP